MVPSFYTTVLQKSPVFRSAVPVRDPQWLEPEFRDRVMKLIADARAAGHELRILETYRSQELQTAYYERGATQLRTVGVHHFGLACDLGIVVAGQVNLKADYGILGELTRKHRLVWGGDWLKLKDFCHFELPDWRSLPVPEAAPETA